MLQHGDRMLRLDWLDALSVEVLRASCLDIAYRFVWKSCRTIQQILLGCTLEFVHSGQTNLAYFKIKSRWGNFIWAYG